MPAADVNGIRIEYDLMGDPDSPLILLVMGLGQQLISWPDDFCAGLVNAGFRILRFDQRDTGLTTKIEGKKEISLVQAFLRAQVGLRVPAPYTLEDLASDAVGLVDHVGAATFHVVGASMGGMVAQIVAHRCPSRVRSLTSIMSTSSETHLPPARPDALALIARGRPKGTREQLIEFGVQAKRILAGPAFPTPEDEMRAVTARAVDRMWYPPAYARHTLAVLASGDRKRLLSSLQVPTLVLHGGDDPLVPVAHGQRVAELVPGARFVVIEGMGHDLPPGAKPLLVEHISNHARAFEASAPSD